ncbi:GYF domain containing protein [Nitzschia inconspicua]|uniref:GYF domain containing protein n=1 Tax=Nitzschia inconspicua TaxID=303405 RepID=A0A9K3PEG0_9STRA|nr:GYF domain containing protein [Nitzschia inconspicua]
MSSTNGNKRSVRFSEESIDPPPTKRSRRNNNSSSNNDDADYDDEDDDYDRKPVAKPMKKKSKVDDRMNEDELDDVDDWKGDDDNDDDDETEIPSEKELLEAKRRRRQQRGSEFNRGDTHIDSETSLAAEGVKIEPFHMREEETDGSGYFDGDTYVFRRNNDVGDDGEPDAWADSLRDDDGNPTTDLAKIPVTTTTTASTSTRRSAQDELDDLTKEQLYERILPLVSDSETVARAIRRYGQLVKQQRIQKKQQQRQEQGSSSNPVDDDEDLAKTCLNELTGVSNALLLKGEVDIYDTTREHIVRRFSPFQHDNAGDHVATNETPKNVTWEYVGNQDNQVHGPVTTEQMLSWTNSGYFVGEQRVKIRYIQQQEQEVTKEEEHKKELTQDDLLADLMDDDDDDDAEPPSKKTKTTNTVVTTKGDWIWSNEVDYQKYL